MAILARLDGGKITLYDSSRNPTDLPHGKAVQFVDARMVGWITPCGSPEVLVAKGRRLVAIVEHRGDGRRILRFGDGTRFRLNRLSGHHELRVLGILASLYHRFRTKFSRVSS